ncbi:MAG: hypothetical protein U5K43_13515 [Halofilum sp. (in: g-proteobacteria)]|nr:hypothetical protein [Halofilum sp. (in: g-proteobacteria)]
MDRLLAGALAVVAALPFAQPAHAQAEGIIVGTTDTVQTLDPAKCYSFYCSNIYHNVGQTLVSYPPAAPRSRRSSRSRSPTSAMTA